MSRQHVPEGRLAAAYYPYGRSLVPHAGIDFRLSLGSAEVSDEARQGQEEYDLERVGEHWHLRSKLFHETQRLLASVHCDRLPVDPVDAGRQVLMDLWELRLPQRLRLLRCVQFGVLGRLRWQEIEARVARGAQHLEHVLRTEGHSVRSGKGPIGTTEHVLLLRCGSG